MIVTMTTAIAVALIGAAGLVVASRQGARIAQLERDRDDAKRELDACTRERKHLKHILQLVVSAIIGQLPPPQRNALLETLNEGLESLEDAA